MNYKARVSISALAVGLALAGAAQAEGVKFMDPTGDDKGPGGYTYPTDGVYTAGSFDLVEFEGSKQNNIILTGVGTHNFAPFLDTRAGCPASMRSWRRRRPPERCTG